MSLSASKIMTCMHVSALELLISRFLAMTVVFFALFTTQENQKITTFYVITPHINLNQSTVRNDASHFIIVHNILKDTVGIAE